MSDPKAPYLHIAAFWCETDRCDEVADAMAHEVFPRPEGFRGSVVTFRYDVADKYDFQHVMRRLDLAEVNERPEVKDPAPCP